MTNAVQTKTVELPSDSQFAVALINQRQAAKEEQQRIKNLVLNYDLQSDDYDGEKSWDPRDDSGLETDCGRTAPNDKPISHHHHNRIDMRSGKERGQRVRRLQLSDVDWYDTPPPQRARKEDELVLRSSLPHIPNSIPSVAIRTLPRHVWTRKQALTARCPVVSSFLVF